MLLRATPLLLSAAALAQQEIWVDPVAGSDVNPGTYASPLQTLTAAVFLAGANDEIHLLPGVYSILSNGEQFPIALGLQPQQDLVIRGIGDVEFDLAGGSTTVFRLASGATGARLTNLTIRNSAQTDAAGNNWWVRAINSGTGANSGNAAMDVEIDRCRFLDINRGIVLWTSDNVTGWKVHDCLFYNCANDGILEYVGTNEFYNNTFYTGQFKAYISDSTTSTAHNNLIVDYNIAFENNNAANNPAGRYEGNWVYQTTTVTQGAGHATPLPTSNVIGTDPLLVNPGSLDFHLQASSPAIDAGVDGTFPAADLDANSRLVDGDNDGTLGRDVGCYEWTPLRLTGTWDPLTQLIFLDTASTVAGTFGVVAFSFDDGVVTLPGQGPFLVDAASWVPFLWTAVTPGQLVFPATNAPPGARLVAYMFGLTPNQVGTAFVGGNQVWLQL